MRPSRLRTDRDTTRAAPKDVEICSKGSALQVEVTFASSKMRRTFETSSGLAQKYGPRLGKVLERRVIELMALSDLSAGFAIPHLHLHQLSTDKDEQFAVTLIEPQRLILRVANDPVPRLVDGGIDVAAVTAIEISEVVDYH